MGCPAIHLLCVRSCRQAALGGGAPTPRRLLAQRAGGAAHATAIGGAPVSHSGSCKVGKVAEWSKMGKRVRNTAAHSASTLPLKACCLFNLELRQLPRHPCHLQLIPVRDSAAPQPPPAASPLESATPGMERASTRLRPPKHRVAEAGLACRAASVQVGSSGKAAWRCSLLSSCPELHGMY